MGEQHVTYTYRVQVTEPRFEQVYLSSCYLLEGVHRRFAKCYPSYGQQLYLQSFSQVRPEVSELALATCGLSLQAGSQFVPKRRFQPWLASDELN